MKTIKNLIVRIVTGLFAIIVIVLIFIPKKSTASHFRYGTLSWKPGGVQGEVIFSLKMAFERDEHFNGLKTGDMFTEHYSETKLEFGDGSSTDGLRFIVTSHSESENWIQCEALQPGSNTPEIKHIYANCEQTITAFISNKFASDSDPQHKAKACCRIGEVVNASSGKRGYNLQTTVTPLGGNSSPVAAQTPVVKMPNIVWQGMGFPHTFTIAAHDNDGDKLRFRFATAEERGFPGQRPDGTTEFTPAGLAINENTGVVGYNIPIPEVIVGQLWAVSFMIEDLDANGNPKSKTPLDMMIKIIQREGKAPSATISSTGVINATCGSPVNFSLTITDLDQADMIDVSATGVPQGMTFNPPLPNTFSSGTVINCSYTPTRGQNGSHVILFSLTDSKKQETQTMQAIKVTAPALFDISSDMAGCIHHGYGATHLKLHGPDNFTTYLWTGPGGFTSSLKDPVRIPAVEGKYLLTAESSNCGGTAELDFSFGPNTTKGPLEVCATTATSHYESAMYDVESFTWRILDAGNSSIIETGHTDFSYIRTSGSTVTWDPNFVGTATVIAEGVSLCGKTYNTQTRVFRSSPPATPFNTQVIQGPTLVRPGTSTVYTIAAPAICSGNAIEWSVDREGNRVVPNGTSATIIWGVEGNYTVTARNTSSTPCALPRTLSVTASFQSAHPVFKPAQPESTKRKPKIPKQRVVKTQ